MALKEERNSEAVIIPIVESLGYTYVGTEFVKKSENGSELIVSIDKPGGVDLEDCELVSKALDEPLDKADPIEEAYVLVVSSPGLGRTLRTEREWLWGNGKKVDVKLFAKTDGKKDFVGELVYSGGDSFKIVSDDGETREFLKNKTASVRLHIDF